MIFIVLLINNQHDMCSELDLFVNRLPMLLPILPVQAKTCAFRYLSPVLLKCNSSLAFYSCLTFGVVVVNHSLGDMNSSNLIWGFENFIWGFENWSETR